MSRPSTLVVKIYKFILYNTLVIGLYKYYSVVKDLFHTKNYFCYILFFQKNQSHSLNIIVTVRITHEPIMEMGKLN